MILSSSMVGTPLPPLMVSLAGKFESLSLPAPMVSMAGRFEFEPSPADPGGFCSWQV